MTWGGKLAENVMISRNVENREHARRCTCASLIVDINAKTDAVCMYCTIERVMTKARETKEKYCPKCERDRPASDFNVRKRNGVGSLYSWCRECSKARSKEYHKAHRSPTRRTAAEYKKLLDERRSRRMSKLALKQTVIHNPLARS